MGYTFGGATGDDITWTGSTSIGANSSIYLVMGWYYPTTLTATRKLWGCGTVVGAEIDTTTSELRLRSDNTTDGQWTTSGVGLAIDSWHFIAVMGTNNNTGPAVAWRVWKGTIDSEPTECTVTVATSPAGNNTGNAAFTIGNAGSAGTAAFQGVIDSVIIHATATGTILGGFRLAGAGAITQAEADFIKQRFVMPAWRGLVFTEEVLNTSSQDFETSYWSGRTLADVRRKISSSTSIFASVTPTYSGAVSSELRSPVMYRDNTTFGNIRASRV